MQYIGLTTW